MSFNSQKNQSKLIQSKILLIACVHFISKTKSAFYHRTWDIGYIWHLQRKLGYFMSINICTLWNKSFDNEKIQPNLIPSKIISIGWVDLNSKKKFAIYHWTWEIGWIWHFLRKSDDTTIAIQQSIAVISTRFQLIHGSLEQ